jgi:predicted ArsR family transcriptional regulator
MTTFGDGMDWLTTLAGDTRSRLLRLVRGAMLSINELAAALGITDNAVRTHIAALERDGLVRQAGTQRSTGGKPARLYELTPAAEELFPKAYALVLAELVATVREEGGEEAAIDLLRRVGHRLGARGVRSGDEAAARVAAAAAMLESIGGSVEVTDREGGWTIQASGCPLSRVVAEDPRVCTLAQSLVEAVTGRRVVEFCDRSGRPRCAFRVFDEPPPPGGAP